MKSRILHFRILILILAMLLGIGQFGIACNDDEDEDDKDTNDDTTDDDATDDDDDATGDDDNDDAADDDDSTGDDDDDDDDDDDSTTVGNRVGDQIPDFTLTNSTGGTTTLYDQKGKVILLDCAAMW